jgi:L-threonylcarbamoyladenylate synthase
MALTEKDAETFERCMSVGGFAVFPTDTVYGLACDPDAKETLQRIYLLKRRPPTKPSAILFFDKDLAQAALPELPPAIHSALDALLPGAVTLLVPNPRHRYPLACGPDPDTLGIRVPKLDGPMTNVRWPVLQTSANLAGEPDPRTIDEVPQRFRDTADLVLDAGELPGTPSTVIDLREFELGSFTILREGAVPQATIAALLAECAP